MMHLFGWAGLLAATVIAVPTPPGLPSTDVTAHHGVVYQTADATQPTQGFLDIYNTGPLDTLTGVACPIADTTSMVDGAGRLVAGVTIPAGRTVSLVAGGTHLQLQKMHFSVQYGGVVPCSLKFAHAGTVSIFLYAKPAP